jgi:uncharacterized protein (TIGR02118 family)
VFVVHLRNDMPREEALRYWRDVHGPIAGKTPGLVKYVQNHATSALQGDLAFDGIGELWFESSEALEAAMASPEWQATLADAPNFIVVEQSPAAFVSEITVV